MGNSRFWLKMADVESKSIPHELPSSHWLKATGQCVLERYLSATMPEIGYFSDVPGRIRNSSVNSGMHHGISRGAPNVD